jgi:hypothetical protein
MAVALSGPIELESGAGISAQSGEVACDTNVKTVILLKEASYRDMVWEVNFSGSWLPADLNAGSVSVFSIILNDVTIYNVKIDSLNLAPKFATVSVFAPRNSTLQITQLDLDTTGSCTTVARGYFLEPPVPQQ